MKVIKKIIAKYPRGYEGAAAIPVLHLAQEQHGGWLPLAAMDKVAKILGVAPMQIYEVSSFYTMFNRSPSPPSLSIFYTIRSIPSFSIIEYFGF